MASITETTPQNVADLFSMSTAMLVFDDGREISSAELVTRAEQRLSHLRAQGFTPGDRMALHRGNDVEAIELLLAAALGGIVVVAVNTKYSTVEVDDLVQRSGARHPDLSTTDSAPPAVVADALDLPFIIFTTSGTTSKPKMVLHHQRSIVEHTVEIVEHFGYSPSDTVLMALPLCGTFGLSSLIAAVTSGARVLVHQFSVDGTAALTHRERITAMNGSDDMFHRLLLADADLSHLQLSGYAQFNTSLTDIVKRAEAVGARLTGL
ncbi:MAG: AMP-binding protein, partial [Ilumatobacteraceae bacterium]